MIMSQEILDAKSDELKLFTDELVNIIREAVELGRPMHEVESDTFRVALRIGHKTLRILLDLLGNGDVGEEYELPDGRRLKRSEEPHARPYVSIFGEFNFERYVYAEREGQRIEVVPLDARLALPESKFSYLLQDWDQHFAMEQPFGKVSQTVEKILGLEQYVDSLERINRQMAQQADAFRMCQEVPPHDEEGSIFVETADGKGVPIRRPADAPPIYDHQPRMGPKPDRKKCATLGSVYSIDPFRRTAKEVVESLFRDPKKPREKKPRPRPCHKRVMASLNYTNAQGEEINGRAAVFGWISDEVLSRNPGYRKPIVCIMDGEENLWSELGVFQSEVPMEEVLDLLHVTPRLWKAAHLFHKAATAAAEHFVRDRVLRILRGEVNSVIRGLRRMRTTKGFRGKKSDDIEKICKYFEHHQHRMRYHIYLARGYPIASGVIEGACRHVVKDRLERTGMNWVLEGAQAMLDLRCIYVSDQWQAFQEFRITKETKRLYPYRDSLDALPWHVAA